MTAEWLAAVTAVIAAFVAGGASIFAYSQAVSARRQADSSERSADTSERSAESASEQALEARRANDANDRLTRGRAIAAIDSYGRALSSMMQESEHWIRKRSAHANSALRRQLAEAARTKREHIIAALTSAEQRQKWRVFEAEFDAMDMYLSEIAAGGAPYDASDLTFSAKKSPPASPVEVLLRINELWGILFELRDEFDR